MKNVKKVLALILITVVAFTALSACGNKEEGGNDNPVQSSNGGGSEDEEGESGGDESPQEGGIEVTAARLAEAHTFDPNMIVDSNDVVIGENMNEGLYKANANGSYDLGMAESVDISDDGLVYTYHIRDSYWSNGDPVTANDFEYSWKRLANPETGAEYAWMFEITGIQNANDVINGEADPDTLGVKAIDEKTLEVTLEYPVSFLSSVLRFPTFAPVNQKFCEEKGADFGMSVENTISCGAFKLAEWEPGATECVLTKNENYYDADNVEVSRLTFKVVKDTQAAVMAFEAGEVDTASISGEYYQQYAGTDKINSFPVATLRYISCNLQNEDLANLNMRLALAYGINKNSICDDVLKNGSVPANFVVPGGNFAVGEDGKNFRETAGATYLEYDLAKAQEYYETAKQELGKDSFTFRFLYDDTSECKEIAQFIKSDVESNFPGITLELNAQPKQSRVQLMKDGDYDLGFPTWGADYQDATTFLDLWKTGNGNNFGKWSNADYDQAMSAEFSADTEARMAGLIEAEKILCEEVPILPTYQSAAASLLNPELNIPVSASDDYVFRLTSQK